MDYLELILTFNQKYGKKWYIIYDLIFFRFLIVTLIITGLSIYYFANHNFNKEDIYRAIGNRYKDYIVSVYATFEHSYTIDTGTDEEYAQPLVTKNTEKVPASASISGTSVMQAPRYEGLLFDDEYFETLSHETDVIAPPTRFFNRSNRRGSGGLSSTEKESLLDERNYRIYRNAGLYLDIPKYLLEDKPNYIYRDQEDVLKVIYSKSAIIESCYQKAARRNLVNAGFVKVEFQIASNGSVLPASIRILDSTIRNKNVEQCIKKNIRRWHSFQKLENSKGVAHIIHKFVFN